MMKKPLKVAINRYSEAGGNSKQTLILFGLMGHVKNIQTTVKLKLIVHVSIVSFVQHV